MNRIKIAVLSCIAICFLLISCEETTTPTGTVIKMTKADMKKAIGYEWFDSFWNLYNPDTAVVAQIRQAFDPGTQSFYLFVESSCTCKETDRSPADMIKALDMAGVAETYYTFYSMPGVGTTHPLSDKITLKSLPSAYMFRAGVPVYSIIDTFSYYENRKYKSIELIILDAVKNY